MTDYRDKVARYIRERTGLPLMNGSLDDAAIITQEAFANARNSVRILANKLNPDCYAREPLRNAAKYFLADPDHRLEILVEPSLWDTNNNFEWRRHPFVEGLREFAVGEGKARRFTLKAVPHEWVTRYKFNFLLLDDYGYRFEADRARPAAVAAFLPDGQTKAAARYHSIFDDLSSVSADLPLN